MAARAHTENRTREDGHAGAPRPEGRVEDRAEEATGIEEARLHRLSAAMRRRPGLTIAATAGVALTAAALIGVGEVAVAGAAAYLAYKWLHDKRPAGAER